MTNTPPLPRRITPAVLEQLARPFPAAQARAMTEKEFQAAVVAFADALGWWSYHPHDSRHSQRGWPDLSLLRGPRLVFLELKRHGGKVTPAQADCHDRFRVAGQEIHVFRPEDWPAIVHLLVKEPEWPR